MNPNFNINLGKEIISHWREQAVCFLKMEKNYWKKNNKYCAFFSRIVNKHGLQAAILPLLWAAFYSYRKPALPTELITCNKLILVFILILHHNLNVS